MAEDTDRGPLKGERVELRPMNESDVPRMVEMLQEECVRRWWGTFDHARAHKEMLCDDDVITYAIEADGGTVGAIMWHEEDEPDYKRAAMDIFVGAESQGTGVALDALVTVARYLFEVRGHHAIDIDPHVENARAIRAYEKIGFKAVGVRRCYERGDDGTWHNNLLLDLLPEELVDAAACYRTT